MSYIGMANIKQIGSVVAKVPKIQMMGFVRIIKISDPQEWSTCNSIPDPPVLM